jgi:hypothetical protein
METTEKREYIKNHLNRVDEGFISEVYQRMLSMFNAEEPVVGYDAKGNPINRTQFIAEIKEAEKQIERGDYLTLEELEDESGKW